MSIAYTLEDVTPCGAVVLALIASIDVCANRDVVNDKLSDLDPFGRGGVAKGESL